MILGGVIYLQSIAERRIRGRTIKNLDVLHQICGDKALARVILGTTNWGEDNEEIGKDREQELATNFLKTMIDSGSKMLRFYNTKESARAFLNTILGQLKFDKNGKIKNDTILRIQYELVDLHRSIPETAAVSRRHLEKKKELVDLDRSIPGTAAGQELHYTLERHLKMMKTDEAAGKIMIK